MSQTLLAVGDLAMDRESYDECFASTRGELLQADITFGQLETSFASTGTRLPQARHAVLARPDGAGALARAAAMLLPAPTPLMPASSRLAFVSKSASLPPSSP